jgi:serine/threonine-protein kinase
MTNKVKLSPEIQSKVATGRVALLFLRRQYDAAAREAEKIPDPTLASFPGALCGKYSSLGAAKKALRDEAGARQAFLKAKELADQLVKQNPDVASAHAQVAEVLAWLGEKDAALATIKHAQEMLPESKDAFGGPEITAVAAEIYAILGETDKAVATLDAMLSKPGPVTVSSLKMNPIWDPIRSDPRFQALIEKYGAKV